LNWSFADFFNFLLLDKKVSYSFPSSSVSSVKPALYFEASPIVVLFKELLIYLNISILELLKTFNNFNKIKFG
jgi:hypothetical protein